MLRRMIFKKDRVLTYDSLVYNTYRLVYNTYSLVYNTYRPVYNTYSQASVATHNNKVHQVYNRTI